MSHPIRVDPLFKDELDAFKKRNNLKSDAEATRQMARILRGDDRLFGDGGFKTVKRKKVKDEFPFKL